MISLREARAVISEQIQPLPPVRTLLNEALGRVLREAAAAPRDLPAFDRSAMDGYAVCDGEAGARLRIRGEATPGWVSELRVVPGECIRIFTGAAIPEGATCVVPQEWITREGEEIVLQKSGPQDFIRRRGEDARAGDVLLPSGTVLGAGELSLLAQIGLVEPLVSPIPRVVHIATGDELVAPDQEPQPGQIRDSNSTLVAALLAEQGIPLLQQARSGDDAVVLRERVRSLLDAGCDMVLLSGGASVGDYDFGPRVLQELGFTVHFRQLNLRPGKPLVFATRGPQAAFVIPGNPVSHFVTFHTAIRAALQAFVARDVTWPELAVRLSRPVPSRPDPRFTLWPARLFCEEGRMHAEPLQWQSSGDLRGLVGADGLLQIPGGSPVLEAGADASCLLLRAPSA
jgi:molybdopterin molybdotransferase